MRYLQDFIERKIKVDEHGLHGDLQELIEELIAFGWRHRSAGNPLAHIEVPRDGMTLVFEYDPRAPRQRIKVHYKIGKVDVYQPLDLCDPIGFEISPYYKKASGF